jgi:hypothetical protein
MFFFLLFLLADRLNSRLCSNLTTSSSALILAIPSATAVPKRQRKRGAAFECLQCGLSPSLQPAPDGITSEGVSFGSIGLNLSTAALFLCGLDILA